MLRWATLSLSPVKPGSGTIKLDGYYIRTHGGDVDLLSGSSITLNNATLYTRGGNVNLTSGGITITDTGISTQGGR